MRLITILLTLLLASSGAWAEWVKVGETDNAVFYIDPATIRKEGNLRRVWNITDLKQRGNLGELSRRARYEYDCKQERQRILSISGHSGPKASGETLGSEGPTQWNEIPPETVSETIIKLVCAK